MNMNVAEVWVIDDDRSIRWVLEKALDQAGITCRSFETGDAARRELGRHQPSALISDIRMPGIDGLELLRTVNRDYPELPVIIMTAHSDLDSAVASYQGGAFEYLPKPFDVDEVVEVTRRALAQAQPHVAAAAFEEQPPTEMIGEAPPCKKCFERLGGCRIPISRY
jgi:two-component system nitrogen regulation response regulator GlnG